MNEQEKKYFLPISLNKFCDNIKDDSNIKFDSYSGNLSVNLGAFMDGSNYVYNASVVQTETSLCFSGKVQKSPSYISKDDYASMRLAVFAVFLPAILLTVCAIFFTTFCLLNLVGIPLKFCLITAILATLAPLLFLPYLSATDKKDCDKYLDHIMQ